MKTKNRAHHAASYSFRKGEGIVVDANVWLYLYPPASQPAPSWAAPYTAAYAKLLKAGAEPVVDALILSEYINRYLRIEQKAQGQNHLSPKMFRESPCFRFVYETAVAEAKEILKTANTADTPLKAIDLHGILAESAAGQLDFNDGVILETCRHSDWKLLTNDRDMNQGGIEIITANGKLLKTCPL